MFTNVIVPLNGSHDAEAAIPVARILAALGGGRLSLLRVVHRPAGLFASHLNQVREASAYLEEVVRDTLAGVNLPIATHVRSGDVVEAILNEVDESASNAIVMTTRGHGGVVRAVLGSVASELLGKSPVPVVLVRAGARPIYQFQQILVPVDSAPESEQALASAAELASAAGAQVRLLKVVTPTLAPMWALEGAGPVHFGQYVDPAEIDRAALADIVMRTRGHTGAARAVLGSVADAVARSAAAPVMLLRGDGVQPAAARYDRALVALSGDEWPRGSLAGETNACEAGLAQSLYG
jgi:nucleotide-binding universal stress UspA family protein